MYPRWLAFFFCGGQVVDVAGFFAHSSVDQNVIPPPVGICALWLAINSITGDHSNQKPRWTPKMLISGVFSIQFCPDCYVPQQYE